MKFLFYFLILTLFGCESGNSTAQFLGKTQLDLAREYEETKERILHASNEWPEINHKVKDRTLLLDSIYRTTSEDIKEGKEPSAVLQNFKETVKSQLFPNKDLGFIITEELPNKNTKECALIEATQFARELLNELALEVGAQDMRFDEVNIFTDVENSLLNEGDFLEAKIYFGAYAGNTEKAFNFFADGEKIEIRNGVGYLKRKVESPGQNEIKILVKSKDDYWIAFEKEKTLNYTVK